MSLALNTRDSNPVLGTLTLTIARRIPYAQRWFKTVEGRTLMLPLRRFHLPATYRILVTPRLTSNASNLVAYSPPNFFFIFLGFSFSFNFYVFSFSFLVATKEEHFFNNLKVVLSLGLRQGIRWIIVTINTVNIDDPSSNTFANHVETYS